MRIVTLDGFTFDDQAIAGVRFTGQKLTGWLGAAGTNLTLTKKPRGTGSFRANTPSRNSRTIVFETTIRTVTEQLMLDALDAVNSACTVDEARMTVELHGDARWAMVSQQDDVVVTDYPNPLVKKVSLQLAAADGRRFGDELTASTALPSSSGGLTVPFTVPFTIASTVVSGTCSIVNRGNETGPVRLRINGPVTAPVVTHVGTGRAIVFSSSITLAAGEWIDVDMEAQTVLAQGQSSRSGWVVERGWSGLDAGVNTWAFTAAAPAAGTLQVAANPAWR